MSTQTAGGSDITEMDDQFIGSLFVAVIFMAVTGFMLNFINQNTNIFSDSGFGSALVQIMLGIGVIFTIAILANYKALDFLQDYATGILLWSYRLMFALIVLIFFALGLLIPGAGIIFFVIGGLLAVFFVWLWPRMERRIRLAAEWVKVSATVVLAEPGMIALSFFQSIVVGIAGITEFLAVLAWNNYAEEQNVSQNVSDGVFYGILFLYLWLTLSILYYFDGANTYIAYVRIHGYDPKVWQGINAATKKLLSIVFYALISAIVTAIVYVLSNLGRAYSAEGRETKNPGLVFFGMFIQIMASIAATIYHFVSFFTLPSIIIKQNTTMDGMRESNGLFRRLFWDVIVSDTGYSFAAWVMYIVTALILGVMGFGYGYFVAAPAAGTEDAVFWGFVVGILALILGLLITKFFLRPLWTTLVTTIYVYATEGPEVISKISPKLIEHLKESENLPKAQPGSRNRNFRL